jgi:dolichol-phosphate mannosyltransferase
MANERDTAVRFVEAVLAECEGWREILFHAVFDNVCTDGSIDIVRGLAESDPRIRVVWAPENRCVVDAYVAGYRAALATGFEWVLEIDAGFSHQPEDVHRFTERLGPEVDCVFGSRFCPGGSLTDAPPFRYFLSRGGTIVSNLLLGTRLTDMTSGYQLFRREALEAVLKEGIHSRGHFFQTEMKFHCRGFRCIEVPIHYRSPSKSVSGKTVGDALGNLLGLVKKRITGPAPTLP